MRTKRNLSVLAAFALTAGAVATPVAVAQPSTPATADVTSDVEAQRVDRVDVSGVSWAQCFDFEGEDVDGDPFFDILKNAQCSELAVPLDYDKPHGEQYNVQVLRQPAANQAEKIGTLFINPGGPGGSAWFTALASPTFMDPSLLAKFDIVGVEPRGIGMNKSAQCFANMAEQEKVLSDLMTATYPEKGGDYVKYFNASRKIGTGCANQTTLQQHMSTAEVVRDMDVARRAVGDDKLSFIGFSYGTALGQYYANMFPDRVRAIVNDGVVDAKDWTGTDRNGHKVLDDRLGSAVSADAAFAEVLRACDAAGPSHCRSAANETDPTTAVQKWQRAAEALEKGPIPFVYEEDVYDEEGNVIGKETVEFLISKKVIENTFLPLLYRGQDTAEILDSLVADLMIIMDGGDPYAEEAVAAGTRIRNVQREFETQMKALTGTLPANLQKHRATTSSAEEEEYYGGFDGFSAVICTDGMHPMMTPDHMRQADQMSAKAPLFGKAWAWGTVHCSKDTWSATDRNAYFGPFNKKTAAPVLYVGNQWDPATAQAQAVKAANRQPGASLITSNSWGHTAYGSSACVTDAVNKYLLTGESVGKLHCEGDYQPFTKPLNEAANYSAQSTKPQFATVTGRVPAVPVGSPIVLAGLTQK